MPLQRGPWNKMGLASRIVLAIGLFAEEKMKVTVVKKKCPRCKGKAALSGFQDMQLQLKRMEKVCWGTGYHRSITVR